MTEQAARPQPELIPFIEDRVHLMQESAEEVHADRSDELESGRRMGWYEVLSSLKNHCAVFDFPLGELALDTYDAGRSDDETHEDDDDDEVRLPLPELIPFIEDRVHLMQESAEEANARVTDDFEAGRGLAYLEALALTRALCAALGVPLRARAERKEAPMEEALTVTLRAALAELRAVVGRFVRGETQVSEFLPALWAGLAPFDPYPDSTNLLPEDEAIQVDELVQVSGGWFGEHKAFIPLRGDWTYGEPTEPFGWIDEDRYRSAVLELLGEAARGWLSPYD